MTFDPAPFDVAVSEGPDFGRATWVHTSDGVRLRVSLWKPANAHATIVLFTGRTEYCEKYGRVARDLTEMGYAVAAIDWRGQGLSDRLMDDTRLGHVLHFHDYQKDVEAYLSAVDQADLPGPRFLIAHSMGGAIGLRAVLNGTPFERAVFSAPMWGIYVSPLMQPLAATLPWLAQKTRQELRIVPGTTPGNYIASTGFADNRLTHDPDHYDFMRRQIAANPSFALGGPTLNWLFEARAEIRALYRTTRAELPCLTLIGTEEEIVDAYSVEEMHRGWPSARLVVVEGGRHELMMETPDIRQRFFDEALAFFAVD